MRLDFDPCRTGARRRSWRRCSTGTARWVPRRPSARCRSIGCSAARRRPVPDSRPCCRGRARMRRHPARKQGLRSPLPAASAPARRPPPTMPSMPPAPAAPRQFPATAPEAAVMAARAAAREAATLDDLGRPARRLRRLQPQGHGQEPVLLPRHAEGAPDADRRGPGAGRGPGGQAVRRPRRTAARQDAGGDPAVRAGRAHHQHRLLAPARQPHAHPAGGAGVPAVPRAAGGAGGARARRAARRRGGQAHARGCRWHHAHPRQMARDRDRQRQGACDRHAASRPICCARRPPSGWPGATCWPSRPRWAVSGAIALEREPETSDIVQQIDG